MLAVACTWFTATDINDLFDRQELTNGIHGVAVETSMMLHLHPGLVDMAKAENFRPASTGIESAYKVLKPEGRTGFGWQTQDLHAGRIWRCHTCNRGARSRSC